MILPAKTETTANVPLDKDSLISSLNDNPYFTAGFGLVGIGAALSILRRLSTLGYSALFKRYTVSLEVVSRDKSYNWLLQWMNNQLKRKCQHLSVDTQFEQNKLNDRIHMNFDFKPSLGIHYFKFNKYWIRAERVRESTTDRLTGFPVETLKLTTLGRNVELFQSILNETRAKALNEQVGKTLIYNVLGTDWVQFGHANEKRRFDTVVLDNGVADGLLNDVKDFLGSSNWYRERGIPYRRGYLLFGPPGCGKTSFITALAGAIDYDIAVANLSDKSISDDRINVLFSKIPLNTILLLEDIDASFINREFIGKKYEGMAQLTLSGLLNALDGVTASEGRIVFMTTNYIDRLDAALVRPGRCDVRQLIGYCSEYQIYKMFTSFYPHESHARALYFAQEVQKHGKNVSAALLQGYFMLCKKDAQKALDNIDEFFGKL